MDVFPVPNPTQPYWLTEPHRLASFRSSDVVPEAADIVIIGTGMAGVGTAYHILDQCKSHKKPSIAILEARDACSGATGRNGGHIKANLSAAKRLYEQLGAEEAAKLLSWIAEQRRAVHKVAQNENIDCQLLATKTFDVYYDEKHAAEMRSWLQDRRKEGVDWLDDIQWLEGPYLDRVSNMFAIVSLMLTKTRLLAPKAVWRAQLGQPSLSGHTSSFWRCWLLQ